MTKAIIREGIKKRVEASQKVYDKTLERKTTKKRLAEMVRERVKAREDFRRWLTHYTDGCAVQEGVDGKPWPCGTCVIALLHDIGVRDANPKKDKDTTRLNQVWRSILNIRGDLNA